MLRYVSLSALTAVAVFTAAPAEAKIACNKGFQTVSGQPIATPYCQDNYVGEVARAYGIRVSDAEIRNNPNLKRNVCAQIGRDNRVYIACIDANISGRRGF
jgi:hypothetical protein